jgi:hypothetical protein
MVLNVVAVILETVEPVRVRYGVFFSGAEQATTCSSISSSRKKADKRFYSTDIWGADPAGRGARTQRKSGVISLS